MTDTYLRSLGFTPTDQTRGAGQPAFSHAWRYHHTHMAHDGALLFIEHPLGINSCRLSTLAAPLAAQDVFASIPLHDRPGLESAISAFYAAHGGQGPQVPAVPVHSFRPYRRGM